MTTRAPARSAAERHAGSWCVLGRQRSTARWQLAQRCSSEEEARGAFTTFAANAGKPGHTGTASFVHWRHVALLTPDGEVVDEAAE